MPNSNSITMPVATPSEKFNPKIFVQNRAISPYWGSRDRSHNTSMMTSNPPKPIVNGGNK